MGEEKFGFEKQATDMEFALFLIKHINNPCEDLSGNNVRDVYIREAKRALGTIKNLEAKKLLEDTVHKYQP